MAAKFTVFTTADIAEAFPEAWHNRFETEFEEGGKWHARVVVVVKPDGQPWRVEVVPRHRPQDADVVRAYIESRFPNAEYHDPMDVIDWIRQNQRDG